MRVEHKCRYCGAITIQPDWLCYRAPTTYRIPTPDEFKKGFKYWANMGYKWVEVEVGKTGFWPKLQFISACEKFMCRVVLIDPSHNEAHPIQP